MRHGLHTRINAMRQHQERAVLGLALLLVAPVLAADAKTSHPHKGVLKAYPEEYQPVVSLSEAERAGVLGGVPLFKKTEGETGGRGVAIFRVDAAPEVVWAVLKRFEQYPKWIKNVDDTEVYRREGERIDVRFKISSMGFSVEYFVAHRFCDANRYATWTLDYGRESDLDDSVGYWKVDEIPGQAAASLVTYSVDLRVRGWVPGFIRTLLVDKGLKEATGWVSKVSEARAKAE
jgi:carbon monoxide dehydrogenase subunit G